MEIKELTDQNFQGQTGTSFKDPSFFLGRNRMKNIYIALVHYPVLRDESVITSSITNLDIHDISRVTITYGLGGYFITHPDEKMRRIASELAGHWVSGSGKEANPDRSQALSKTWILPSIDDAVVKISKECGTKPLLIGTTARKTDKNISIKDVKNKKNTPVLILFGTAGGMDDNMLDSLDYILEPIETGTGYNHLSVRSAVSIFIDRLYLDD
jgi:tRNA (guanine37-N1)-methyltransferase